jgi:N6-adenosine-specific RNA methylase IME4
MRFIKSDWKEAIQQPYDYIIADPPWNLNDHPPKPCKQLRYELWESNLECMIHFLNFVKTDVIFLWTLNAIFKETFQFIDIANGYTEDLKNQWDYKNKFTWRKLTTKGNLFYGTGHWNRNCTEELMILAKGGTKPLRLSLRNHFDGVALKDTAKPHDQEAKIVEQLADRDRKKGMYLFSGIDIDALKPFEQFDIDLVDHAWNFSPGTSSIEICISAK